MKVSPALRIRTASAVLSLVAGAGLLAYQPATPPANAATGEDATDSARTYAWSEGIVGADDSIVAPRDPDHLMYEDFADLEVTVSQTENIRGQAIQVSWTGGIPTLVTSGAAQLRGGYLQLMQCWGDENAGPDPETCVWGAEGVAGPPAYGSVASRNLGAAPADPLLNEDTLAGYLDPTLNLHRVPFLAAGTEDPVWDPAPFFDRWTTNEFRFGVTTADGTGQRNFTVQDGTEASHLGCGRTLTTGDIRDCWLVIVPRGIHEVNGDDITEHSSESAGLQTSPMSPTNWAQRIQVHLDFAPIGAFCPIEAQQRPTIGTEMMAAAMYSWQPALCADDGAVYGFTPVSDDAARAQVAGGLAGNPGLGFMSLPVTEDDGPAPVLHAPVAASGLAIAFNIVNRDGQRTESLRVTPRLVAKMLTQSYERDLPGGSAEISLPDENFLPDWFKESNNPETVTQDPEFLELNPDVTNTDINASNLLKVPAEPSDAIGDLWRWIFSDDEAAAWLRGEPDENGMRVNPYFEDVLGAHMDEGTAPDIVPRDVEHCVEVDLPGATQDRPRYCSLDLLPYTNGFEDGARRAAIIERLQWNYNPNMMRPDGSPGGWYDRAEPRESGVAFALTDTVSAARYGLETAALRNAAGEFVAPAEAGLLAGVEAMAPGDVDGVLEIDPEAAVPAAYPLAVVTYAAVRVQQDDQALADYSTFLVHAAGLGQTPGWSPGELPAGYVPLPDDLRAQTLVVAALLVHEEPGEEPPGLPPPSGQGDGGDDPPPGGDASGGPGSDPAGNGASGGADPPDPASLAPAGDDPSGAPSPDGAAGSGAENPAAPEPGDDVLVAQSTPGEPVGPMQYALLVVLIVGLAGALAGPAVLRLGSRAAAG